MDKQKNKTMTTLNNGNKTATVKESTNGYGEKTFCASIVQTYSNGLETVERFIDSKHFQSEKRAINWVEKQLN